MKEQAPIINQPQILTMNQNQLISMGQPQMMNQQHQHLHQPPPSQQQQPQMMVMNPPPQPSSQGMNRNYGPWPPPSVDQLKFQNPMMQPPPSFGSSKHMKQLGWNNWKGKKTNDKRKDGRRKDMPVMAGTSAGMQMGAGLAGSGNYMPPTLNELQYQNRLKARRFFPKKKFNNRSAPFAPRNTTSFLIRAKKAGGIASLVSPCPVTPSVLPTPILSPLRDGFIDMDAQKWGVDDGYGTMKGLIRLRSPGNEAEPHDDEEDDDGGSSESDVEEHLEGVERRLDHDLSRFEIIYPNGGAECNNILENRVDDQDTHIAHLEEENLILKEKLFLMERELGDMRRRLQCLERQNMAVEEINEEVVENGSENEVESQGDAISMEENNEVVEENNDVVGHVGVKENYLDVERKEKFGNHGDAEAQERSKTDMVAPDNECAGDFCMVKATCALDELTMEDVSKNEENGNKCLEKGIGQVDQSNCPV